MGNIQCADSCSTCTCLSLENYTGTECTRMLTGEQPNIIRFVASLLLSLTLFFQFGFVKNFSTNIDSIKDLVDEVFNYFRTLKDKEDKRFIVVIADSALGISFSLILTGLIWEWVEVGTGSDCTTSEDSSTFWAYITWGIIFALFILLLIFYTIQKKCLD